MVNDAFEALTRRCRADGRFSALAETLSGTNHLLLIGGTFNAVDSKTHTGIARLLNNGVVDDNFTTAISVGGSVYAIAVYPTNSVRAGEIIIGGDFTSVNGIARNGIARLYADGSLDILERIEGGKHQVSKCAGAPALLGWATGNLPEPKNNPQVGMVNMRTVMPALQKAKLVKLAGEGLSFASVALPKQLRETQIVKDKSPDDIAKEIVKWIKK